MKQSWYKKITTTFGIGILSLLLSSAAHTAPTSTDGLRIYQKDMHLSEVHVQKLADDIDRYRNAENMWTLLRHEFALPHYETSEQVQEQIAWFLNHQDFLQRSAARAAPYLYFILQQARKRHLPAEVVLLPLIESSYNPFAYSTVGAAGIWQIMPRTASGLGVKQDWWFDGRRDVVASTNAALDHLVYLGNFFEGNWLLGIAAYDTGEGNVMSAIKKNIRAGKHTNFWALPVAQETRIYVPRLLALATIIAHPEEYPIEFPYVRNAPYLAQIDIGTQIDLQQAASLAGMSLSKLKQLNPGYNHSVTDPNGPFKIILPIENVRQFTENLERTPLYQQTNWAKYKIRSGDTWASVAKRFNTTPGELRSANPKLAQVLKPGSHLVIQRPAPELSKTLLETRQPAFVSDNSEQDTVQIKQAVRSTLANNNEMNVLEDFQGHYTLQPGDTLYMVRNGDNLEKIASRFHTSGQTLMKVNQLSNGTGVHPGDKLIIPTHLAQTDSSQKYALTPGDTIYMVRRGDTVEKVSQKFHSSAAAIRLANLLTTNELQEGDRLVIPTHVG